jgi:hypothetical protein
MPPRGRRLGTRALAVAASLIKPVDLGQPAGSRRSAVGQRRA